MRNGWCAMIDMVCICIVCHADGMHTIVWCSLLIRNTFNWTKASSQSLFLVWLNHFMCLMEWVHLFIFRDLSSQTGENHDTCTYLIMSYHIDHMGWVYITVRFCTMDSVQYMLLYISLYTYIYHHTHHHIHITVHTLLPRAAVIALKASWKSIQAPREYVLIIQLLNVQYKVVICICCMVLYSGICTTY